MTVEWKPNAEMRAAMNDAEFCNMSSLGGSEEWRVKDAMICAVRPLLIAEAAPQIEAEERERALEEVAGKLYIEFDESGFAPQIAEFVRALKDSKP